MQQIKFRGKRIDNGGWVTGSLISIDPLEAFILIGVTGHIKRDDYECYMIPVIPETVGQYTTHENGLYVGDIVNYVTGYPMRYVNAVIEYGEYETYTKITYLDDESYDKDSGDIEKHIGFYINDGAAKFPLGSLWIEKIGNIHDNPDLFKPAVKDSVIINMNTNFDPNAQQVAQEIAAVESAAQDSAMEVTQESAEEGSTEG